MSLGILGGYFNEDASPDSIDGAAGEATPPEPPQTDGETTPSEVDKVLGALRKERAANRELQNQIKQMQSKLGQVDLEEYEQLRQAQAEAEAKAAEAQRKKLEEQQKYDELIKLEKQKAEQTVAEYQRQQAELRQQLQAIQEQNRNQAIATEFTQAWNDPEVSGNPRLQQAAFSQLMTEGRLNYNAETRQVEVVNPITKQPEINDLGEPLSVKAYLSGVLRETTPDFFVTRQKGGTGAAPTTGTTGSTRTGTISFEERLKMKGTQRAQLSAIKKK